MKRGLFLLCVLLLTLNGAAAMAETDYAVDYDEEDVLFYKHCYDVSVVHTDKGTQNDPDGYYKHWAAEHQDCSEEQIEIEKRDGLHVVWPDAQDVPRKDVIILSYAAMEQLGGVEREILWHYYTEAVLVISQEDTHVWKVWCMLVADYYDPAIPQYEVFIDAHSGEMIDFKVHTADQAVG